jgi:hypothetical protein
LIANTEFNPLRIDGDLCHQGQDTEIAPKTLRLSKPTDMTIHWKALGKDFLMVPLPVLLRFRGKNAFSVFSSKKSYKSTWFQKQTNSPTFKAIKISQFTVCASKLPIVYDIILTL